MDALTGPYQLSTLPGPMNRPQPQGAIMIGTTHEGTFHALTLPGGHFLFQALRELDIQDVNFLVDVQGKVYGADYRVWRPLNLTTLHPTAWPLLMPSTIQASGLSDLRHGLSDGSLPTGSIFSP